ncbi:YdcF family protein [Alkalihalobacillus macyae]|uniref:YdcF family protein n=1 Tax=Guptibacillus hwajinpoensis TaxID=208199 RepID=UPI00273B29D4|nr:YdcF family protein [Alkalihalobacillus macyae]MDP4552102.1 YdcF family protein [Alkalihalobacillus macyae]
MRLSELNPDRLSKEQLTAFMFDDTCDDGNSGDCILVFGAKTIHRVEKAAKLYHDKRAPSILVTGSAARWGVNETPEAIWMKEHLTKLGVPDEDILVELEAANTTENVIASMMVLQQTYGLHMMKRLLIVSSPFHMKRCLLTLRTYMPDWITYTFCSDDRKVGQRGNWWTDSTEKARVMKEVHSISKYAGLGIIKDVDVPLL